MTAGEIIDRLLDIGDEIDSARWLVECGLLAIEGLSVEEGTALGELLDVIRKRLIAVSTDVRAIA